jgi:hypothetical protein
MAMNKETRETIMDELPYLVCRGTEVLGGFMKRADAEAFAGMVEWRQDYSETPRVWIDDDGKALKQLFED